MKKINIEITPKSIIMLFAFFFLFAVMYQAKDVLLFLFASFVIASALFPVVDWLSSKMKRSLAVLIVFFLSFLAVLVLFIPFFAILVDQSREFIAQVPNYYKLVEQKIINWHFTPGLLEILPDQKEIFTATAQVGENIVSQSINFTISLFGAIVAAFTLATIVLFILIDINTLKSGFLSLFPSETRKIANTIVATISKRVGGYVRGQLFVMLAVGVITGIGLLILKIPFAFLLGMVAGLFEIIPIIGPILAAVPAVLLALAINPWLAIGVIVLYLIIQRIENFISPFVYGKFLNMPPLIIISALLIAASTLGIIGVILSPAIAAAIFVLVEELYLKKINHED